MEGDMGGGCHEGTHEFRHVIDGVGGLVDGVGVLLDSQV